MTLAGLGRIMEVPWAAAARGKAASCTWVHESGPHLGNFEKVLMLPGILLLQVVRVWGKLLSREYVRRTLTMTLR